MTKKKLMEFVGRLQYLAGFSLVVLLGSFFLGDGSWNKGMEVGMLFLGSYFVITGYIGLVMGYFWVGEYWPYIGSGWMARVGGFINLIVGILMVLGMGVGLFKQG